MCMSSKPDAPPPPPPPPQMAKLPQAAEVGRLRRKGLRASDNSQIGGGTLLTDPGAAQAASSFGGSTLLGGGKS